MRAQARGHKILRHQRIVLFHLLNYLFRNSRPKNMIRPAPATSMDVGGSGTVLVIHGMAAESGSKPLMLP
jgi:hypothetical protein